MMKVKFNYKELAGQLGVCLILLLLTPAIVFVLTRNSSDALTIIEFVAPVLVPCFIIFFLNYYLLLPLLFFRQRKVWFFVANMALIPLIKYNFIFSFLEQTPRIDLPMVAWLGLAAVVFSNLLFYAGTICVAWGMLSSKREHLLKERLQEERQRHVEAELVWLRNQINPHFLFNTLNNISSLVAIDSEKAQDSIAVLSDLLRYAMYESNKPTVPLGREVEFMKDYIGLMNLRCSARTEVRTDFSIASESMPIAPLLLVCLVENAYKHGLSSSRPSFIHIALTENDGTLTFVCDNSSFPKGPSSQSHSGIGLANLRRRLDLLYPGRYSWEQSEANEVFHIKLTISLCE